MPAGPISRHGYPLLAQPLLLRLAHLVGRPHEHCTQVTVDQPGKQVAAVAHGQPAVPLLQLSSLLAGQPLRQAPLPSRHC